MLKETFKVYKLVSWKYPLALFVTGGLIIWDQTQRLKNKLKICSSQLIFREESRHDYIYINNELQEILLNTFKADGFSNELYKITQLYFWLFRRFEGSEFYENVFTFHQNLAWRYLRLSQGGDYSARAWAVTALAKMQSLSDSTCLQLAQACDRKTAVGLARTQGVDLRLLLDPPGWRSPVNRRYLLSQLQQFMLSLVREMPHPCLQYVISSSFVEGEDTRTFDDDVGFLVGQSDVVSKSIEAILHHSWLGTNSVSIVNCGGLPLLVDVYKELYTDPKNIETIIMISRILSNISMYECTHAQLFASGCIKVLARLLQHEDIRVSIPAARALTNCDADEVPRLHYHRNVYSLHPVYRSTLAPSHLVDVVFVHGLLGGVFKTWRQRDLDVIETKLPRKGSESKPEIGSVLKKYLNDLGVDLKELPLDSNMKSSDVFRWFRHIESEEDKRTMCWPRDWLAKDCSQLRIIGVNYDTDISKWGPMCPIAPPRQTLNDRSSHLCKVLSEAGVGSKPIIWVAHSMGGLIVKDLLVKCLSSEQKCERALVENTQKIVFFSTPHKGSRLAAMSPASQLIFWPSIEVMELRQNSPALLKLHQSFLKLAESKKIEILSFSERKPTYVKPLKMELLLVEAESSEAGVGESYGVPVDHLSICKPASKQSFIYQKVLQFVVEAVQYNRNRKQDKHPDILRQ